MVFASVAYTLAAFLSIYGVMFFYLGNKSKGDLWIFPMRTIFFVFGFLYIAIAHFSVLSAVAYGVDMSHLAPCENVVANSTAESSTIVTYEYMDSCDDRVPPESALRLFKVFSYIIYIDAFALLIGTLVAIAGLFRKW